MTSIMKLSLSLLVVIFAYTQAALLPGDHGARCSVSFSGQAEHNAEGATPFHDIETVAGCSDLCRNTPECVAFDYDRNEPPYKNARCWIHDNAGLVVKEQPAVDHYTRGPMSCYSVCEDSFSGKVEHNAEGATPYHKYTTVEECAALCRDTPDCIAFDFDRNEPPYKNARCWIHDDPTLVVKEQPAVDHYTRMPCNYGPGCYSEFSASIEHNAEGATPHHDVNTVAGCAELCKSNPECVAFDYDRNDPPFKNARCWIHDDPSIVMKEQPAVDHYVPGPCRFNGACSSPFERFVEHNAEGATPYHDIETVADCADFCRSLSECIAFDYDRNEPPYKNARCWIHDDKSIVMKEQPAVDHYVKGPLVCTNECVDDFTGQSEHNAEGAAPVHEITTVAGCADLCRETPECVAFDYDRNMPPYKNARCWIHTDAGLVVKKQPAVDHYTRTPCPFGSGCMGQFYGQKEHNAEGAVPHYGAKVESVDGCAELCQSLTECLAFDFDRNQPPYKNARCWIHDNPALVVKEQPAVDHYTKGKCAGPLCVSNFKGYVEHNAEGATPHYGYETVTACADRCRETPNCIAFDFDRNMPAYKDARCWIHDDSSIVMKEQPAVDHYVRIPCTSPLAF